jgi:Gpi18-like mannosyltransferase
MSAQATFDRGRVRRGLAALPTLVACGPIALAFVVVGGIAIGLYLWYTAISRQLFGAAGDDLLLAASLVLGPVLAIAGWYAYGQYFARRAGIGIVLAMRWDAASWLSLGVFPLGLLLPIPGFSPTHAAGAAAFLFCVCKLLAAARFVHTVRDVLVTFSLTRIAILMIAELAAITIRERPGVHISESSNPLLAVWAHWDAVHYLDIAGRGYYGTDMAFFPLYPSLIQFAGHFIGNDVIAGLLISNIALFFGLLFFYKLAEHQFNRAVAHRAIFYISIFPTAVFFSAVYTESLFFALTVASFYYIREHKWLTAGIIGALAALTRSEGVLLVVPFSIELIASARSMSLRNFLSPARLQRVLLGLIAIPAGLGLYMAWLWVLHGDPMYFSHVQANWNRHLAWPWVAGVNAYKVIAHSKSLLVTANAMIEIVFTLVMVIVTIMGAFRLRLSYTVYSALSILVPMSTASLMSMPRFALVLFPMFLWLALWGSRSWVNNAIVAFSLPLLGLFTVLFADWYWVA